jgi:hypothetical protein
MDGGGFGVLALASVRVEDRLRMIDLLVEMDNRLWIVCRETKEYSLFIVNVSKLRIEETRAM